MDHDPAKAWWNAAASLDEGEMPLVLPSPLRMCQICEILAPVLYVHLEFALEPPNFWDQVRALLTSISRTACPDPVVNFPDFVTFCHAFRDLLKPETVAHCLFYVDQFCVNSYSSFFLSKFLFAIADPELAVKALHFMHFARFPKWVDFIQERGNVERLYDLLVPQLSVPKGENKSHHVVLQLHLCHLLIDLVLSHRSLTLHAKTATSLFKAVLGLIDTVPERDSIAFMRFALQFADMLITSGPIYLAIFENSHTRLTKLTARATVYRNYFYFWLSDRIGTISGPTCLSMVTRQSSMSISTFRLIDAVAKTGVLLHVHLVVVYLSRCLIQKMTWARISAGILRDIFASGRFDDVCRSWFLSYLRVSFMFVRLASESNRFHLRIVMWASLVAEAFEEIDWVRAAATHEARLGLCETTDFLRDIFGIDEAAEEPDWTSDYEIFKTYRPNLKSLPFKQLTPILVSFPKSNLPYNQNYDRVENAIVELNLDPFFSRYLTLSDDQEPFKQQMQIMQLEGYRDDEVERVRQFEQILQMTRYLNPSQYRSAHRPKVIGFNAIIKETELDILDWQQRHLQKFLNNSQAVIRVARDNPKLSIEIRSLIKQYDKEKFTRPNYLRLRNRRHQARGAATAFATALGKVPAINHSTVVSELGNATFTFISSIFYSPKSHFDEVVFQKISNGNYVSMLRATVLIVATQMTEPAIKTMTEFVEGFFEELSLASTGQRLAIMFTAFVRIVFDEAYTTGPSILNAFPEENLAFLTRCESDQKASLASLGLSPGLMTHVNERKPIWIVFRHKRIPNLMDLQFGTNPIDMVYQVQLVIQHFTQRFALGTTLAYDDMVAVVYGAVVSAPPANPVSIAKFLVIWEHLITGESLNVARRVFLDAVRKILPINEL
jgi:hypothetical protein